MVIVPNSRIRLLKSPIELDERNQLTFSDVNAQTSYFLSLPFLEYDNCTYQRKDNVIRYETEPNGITYEDLLGYNYCMYQNTSYDNKWFYAFITGVKYINDGMTELTIETDVIESWKFEINYKPSFVEREHVSNDALGLHTVPEGLETGEYTEAGIEHYSELDDTCTVMATTRKITDLEAFEGQFVGSKYEGVNYYIFKGVLSDTYSISDQWTVFNAVIDRYSAYRDDITCLFTAPQKLVGWKATGTTWRGVNGTIITYRNASENSYNAVTLNDFSFNRATTIGSYSPKNNKTLCFPYNYFTLSNNNGANAVFHYEDFTYTNDAPNTIKFGVKGVVMPGCSIRAIPKNYKGQSEDYLEGLTCAKYPTCSWANDTYTNWLTQNSVNFAIDAAYKVGGLVVGGAMLASGVGAIGGGAMISGSIIGISESLKSIYQHSFSPVQAEGDINSGDISFTLNKTGFDVHKYQVREEYARIIDNYFTMFGYKVNTLKTPEFESRLNWNYIKTNGLNITGDIPQEDMQKIKDIFNNGITFWHNPSTFLDYSQSNYIV